MAFKKGRGWWPGGMFLSLNIVSKRANTASPQGGTWRDSEKPQAECIRTKDVPGFSY